MVFLERHCHLKIRLIPLNRNEIKMQKRILIGNGRLVTRDPNQPYIENGALLIEGAYIKAIGTTKAFKADMLEEDVDFIDAKGKLIMPGYINAHHHAYSAFARGMVLEGNHPSDFLEILEGTWWKLDNHLDLKATYDSGIATFLGSIQNGVTTVVDHHASYKAIKGSLKALSNAAELTGQRVCLSYEISDRNGVEKMLEAVEESFEFAAEMSTRSDNMQKALIGLHASFTLPDQVLKLCREKNSSGIGYHVHVAEGLYDQEYTLNKYGLTVVSRLIKEGILNENALAGHCIHITEEDMNLLKSSGTTVVHNPQSNMGNAVGAPNILGLMDKDIPVCLGTDGYTNDMLESAKTAMILQKHLHQNPDRGFVEAAKMLFENNAKLASKIFGETIGVLKPGAAADVIIVDYKSYTPVNSHNIDGHLIFGVNGHNTDTTIVNGKVLMRNKNLLIDDEAFYTSCRETSEKVWRNINE